MLPLEALAWLTDAILVSGVVVPYVPQVLQLHRGGDSAFNTNASLILIVSNTLRVAYWVEHRFETTLLVQAVVCVLAQLVLMHALVRNKQRKAALGAGARSPGAAAKFFDFEFRRFWAWTDFPSYLQFELLLCVLLVLLHGTFAKSSLYSTLLGALALGIEATLPIPQALQNWRTRSSSGLPWPILLAWFCGDGFKTVFSIARAVPMPFIVCAGFQFSVDSILLLQKTLLFP